MFALPHPPVLFSPLITIVSFGLVVAVACIAFRVLTRREHNVGSPGRNGETDARKCRYCRRGVAVVLEETVRRDGDDMVDVRCYVCSDCGLPQWSVRRHGVSPHVH